MEPVIVPRSEHPISRKSIDPDAVKVLYRLHRAGYQAYLVGGGVRDLLLGRHPKDFDVGTDAHPHQVKRLFRNCRLIGRRFRLAHVHFGGKIVEVSTFRRRSEPEEITGADGEVEEQDLLIRSDNTFGTAEEDSLRRDFTINGLFYDIGSFTVIDYIGGLDDLKTRTIRTIGDPDIRFREDPVRMIRAIKFAARLDFEIEPETWRAILDNHEEITRSARPRVFEEIYRLLGGGSARRSFELLHEGGLLRVMVPPLARVLDAEGTEKLGVWLDQLDRFKRDEIETPNPILIGALVAPLAFAGGGPQAETDADESGDEEWHFTPDVEDSIREVLSEVGAPRRDTERLFQIFRALRRFDGPRGRRFSPRAFVTKNYFPEAFLFYRLATLATGGDEETLMRWQKLAEEAGLDGSIPVGSRRRRRRRRRRGEGRDSFDESIPSEEAAELDSLAEERGVEEAGEAAAPVEAAPRRTWERAPNGNGPRFERRGPRPPQPSNQRPPQAPRPASHEDEDEDSQIRFLGWSDQPEILRDRPEPPPLVNPYTRQNHGGARRGWRPRSEGGAPSSGGHHRGPYRGSGQGSGNPSGRDGRSTRQGGGWGGNSGGQGSGGWGGSNSGGQGQSGGGRGGRRGRRRTRRRD